MDQSTGKLLRADILANPEDDTPRLIYADWLEEFGGEQGAITADYIRYGVRCPDIVETYSSHTTSPLVEKPRCILANPTISLLLGYNIATCSFNRGFVFRVDCIEHSWLYCGKQLVRTQPITQVNLSHKSPMVSRQIPVYDANREIHMRHSYCWLQRVDATNHPYLLDYEIWMKLLERNPGRRSGLMHEYDSEEVAMQALAVACLEWAHS